MASLIGFSLIAFLFSISFVDQIELNVTPLQKIVDYEYDINFQDLVPETQYRGTITAKIAIPQSSLRGLDGKTINVRVSAKAHNGSNVFFLAQDNSQTTQTEIYLDCTAINGTCSNSSKLLGVIPIYAYTEPTEIKTSKIELKSEILGLQNGKITSDNEQINILDVLKSVFGQNESFGQNMAINEKDNFMGMNFEHNFSDNTSIKENILDSLKPENYSQDTMKFLKENPLISITALAIVIIITGAFLLNAKD